MLKTKVQKGNIEKALKSYKSKIIKTRQMKLLNSKKEFEKPSVKKRRMKQIGKYKQKIRREND
jgi:small subunit ribosomal protein S21